MNTPHGSHKEPMEDINKGLSGRWCGMQLSGFL